MSGNLKCEIVGLGFQNFGTLCNQALIGTLIQRRGPSRAPCTGAGGPKTTRVPEAPFWSMWAYLSRGIETKTLAIQAGFHLLRMPAVTTRIATTARLTMVSGVTPWKMMQARACYILSDPVHHCERQRKSRFSHHARPRRVILTKSSRK